MLKKHRNQEKKEESHILKGLKPASCVTMVAEAAYQSQIVDYHCIYTGYWTDDNGAKLKVAKPCYQLPRLFGDSWAHMVYDD